MKEKLKKCLAFLTVTNIILGTTSCRNQPRKQEEKIIEETQDETTQLIKKLTNKNCMISNNKIYIYGTQKKSWYKNLNKYLKFYKDQKIVITNRMNNTFDLSKIEFLSSQRLELEGIFDISNLTNKNIPRSIEITTDCLNIDKMPKTTTLTIHNTNNTDIANTLKKIEKNKNTPRNLYLYNFTSEDFSIDVDKLTIIYDKEVPSKLMVNTKSLTIIHNTTENNSLVEQNINSYTYENNNIRCLVTNEHDDLTTTALYDLPTIEGKYDQLTIEKFDVDYDKIKSKNDLFIKYGNINATMENIMKNKTKLVNVILNNNNEYEYYSNDTDNTRSYYKVPRKYANELSQGREEDFYKTIFSKDYFIDKVNINENTTEYNDKNVEQTRNSYTISQEQTKKLTSISQPDLLEQLLSEKYEIKTIDMNEKVYVKTNNPKNSPRI